MPEQELKVLLIVEQCNPEWTSVPLVGFRYFTALSRLADVTLVTHERNRDALARAGVDGKTVIIPESRAAHHYNRAAGRRSERRGRIDWPMRHALCYPVYAEFNRRVFRTLSGAVGRGAYDVVHAFSPILPRYPVKMIEACRHTPFVLGPVNGGLPFPAGFDRIARQESGRFSFLRGWARFLPGFRETYRRADKLLAGSSATLHMLRKTLGESGDRIELLHENGVAPEFFAERAPARPGSANGAIRLLFVGRLVACKCADVAIEAVSLLDADVRRRTTLTIVGDGPEREGLETQARRLGMPEQVRFAGWTPHRQTVEYYRRSDLFCFPSVREFGGAVVLEAMAAGLPCLVADYGGIAEYVTEGTGFRIALDSRDHLVRQMARHIEDLARNAELLTGMSARAVERAREFTWESKARRTVSIYENLIERKRTKSSPQLAEHGTKR